MRGSAVQTPHIASICIVERAGWQCRETGRAGGQQIMLRGGGGRGEGGGELRELADC